MKRDAGKGFADITLRDSPRHKGHNRVRDR